MFTENGGKISRLAIPHMLVRKAQKHLAEIVRSFDSYPVIVGRCQRTYPDCTDEW